MTALPDGLFAFAIQKGRVAALSPCGASATVTLGDDAAVEAQVVHGAAAVARGDDVLVASTAEREWYVLGRLGPAPAARAAVSTADGVTARVERDGDAEVLRLRDAAGRLFVEQRGARTVVFAAEGDLELRAPSGSVVIEARDALTLRAGAEASLAHAGGNAVTVGAQGARVEGDALSAKVARASIDARDVAVTAESLALAADRARQTFGVLEVKAGRILEKARDVYREAEGQLQSRAGRMRTVVKETFQLVSRRTVLRSEKDVRVDGEKIYLG